MFDRLMKLANELDSLGRFEEANEVDEIIRALGAGEAEIDIDDAPIDLTEEDTEPTAAPVSPVTPAPDPEMARLREERERLLQENDALKLKRLLKQQTGDIRISPKKAVSVYQLGKWPVTLYADQWKKLFGMSDRILKFIAENEKFLNVTGRMWPSAAD